MKFITRNMYYIAFLPGGVFNGEAPPWGMGPCLIFRHGTHPFHIPIARAKIAVDHRGNFSLSKDSKPLYIFVL